MPSDPPKERSRFRRLLKWTGIVLVVLTVVLGVTFAALQSGPGKRFIAAQVSQLASSEKMTVVVEGVHGFLPFTLRVDSVLLRDEEGEWLSIENGRLSWSPLALLRRRVDVQSLRAESVTVLRSPAGRNDEAPEEPGAPVDASQAISLIDGLIAIDVNELRIDRLMLGEPFLGEQSVASVRGSFDTSRSVRSVTLSVEPIDGPAVTIDGQATLDTAGKTLTLDISASDDDGGFVGPLAGIEPGETITVTIDAAGPLDGLRIDLTVTRGPETVLATTMTGNVIGEYDVALTGSLNPPIELVSESVRTLDLSPTTFEITIETDTRFEAFAFDGRVNGAGTEVTAEGVVNRAAAQLEASARIYAPDLSRYSDLAGRTLGGTAAVTIDSEGDLLQPRTDARVEVSNATVMEALVGNVFTEAAISFDRPLGGEDFPGLTVRGEGAASDVTVPEIPPMEGQAASWSYTIEMPDDQTIAVSLPFQSNPFHTTVTIDAQTPDRGRTGQADVLLRVDNVTPLAKLLGFDGEGQVELTATARADQETNEFNANIDGRATGLVGFDPRMMNVIGSELTITATADGSTADMIYLREAEILASGLQANAVAQYGASSKAISGEYDVSIPDLAALSDIAGRPLGGIANIRGAISGTTDDFQTEADVSIDQVEFNERQFDILTADLKLEKLPSEPQGHADLSLTDGQDTLQAAVDFALGDDDVNVPSFSVSGPGLRGSGSFAMIDDIQSASGEVAIEAEELGLAGRFLNIPLSGSLTANASLEGAGETQRFRTEASGAGIAYGEYALASLALSANVRQPFTQPAGDASLQLNRLVYNMVTLDSFAIEAAGEGNSIRFGLDAAGFAEEPFALASNFNMELGERLGISFQELDASYADYPIALHGPTTARVGENVVGIEETGLSIAGGGLQFSLNQGEKEIDFQLRFEALPLRLLALAGAPELDGTASGSASVTGERASPIARTTVTIADMRMAGLTTAEPVGATANAVLRENRLEADLEVTGLAESPSVLQFAMPIEFSMNPVVVSIIGEAPVDGAIDTSVNLRRIAPYVLPPDMTARGLVGADVAVGGTLAAPLLNGTITAQDGGYQNLDSGTVLRDFNMSAQLDGRRIVLTNLSATDGGGGTMTADGSAELGEELQYELNAMLNEMHLVRLDYATAIAGGEIGVVGDGDGGAVRGALAVSPVTFDIPSETGPDVATLDVEEAGAEDAAGDGNEKPQAPGYPVDLDMSVDLPGKVFVRGRGLESEWRGDLTVTGTAAEPVITGQLTIVRGFFDFLGRRWDLTRCTITFDGSTPPSPVLDITAEVNRGDIIAQLRVVGAASSPSISLTSDPPLPEDEVLSRVLFGRALSEIKPSQAVQLASAARTLSGAQGPITQLTSGLRQSLGIDSLNIQSGDAGFTSSTVGLGKYLTDNIYLEVVQGLATQETGVLVEVDLGRNWAIEAESGVDARSTFTIQYRRDY